MFIKCSSFYWLCWKVKFISICNH